MDLERLKLRLFQVVAKSLRHKHYSHTVKKHKRYMQLIAGVGIDDLLKQYVRREDKDLFDQRVTLTKHITTSVCKNLLDVFYKVPRSNSARRVLTYLGYSPESKSTEIEEMLSKFWGDESWDDYMAKRYIELNSVDPNGFVVFEFDPFDNKYEMVQPKPFEVKSDAAIDYAYSNKKLQYLVVRNTHLYNSKKATSKTDVLDPMSGKEKGYKYTIYGKDQTLMLHQVDEHEFKSTVVAGLDEGKIVYESERTGLKQSARMFVMLGGDYYEYFELEPHNSGAVPAFRVGYYRDLSTDGETYVSPIHAAQPYIEKTIKVNSELDLVATLLAFPQMIRYGQVCDDESCYKGVNQSTGSACKSCGGSGIKASAPSSQDSIVLRMPPSKEEMIPLGETIKYINPPVDIVEWQQQYIDHLVDQCKTIMFNSDIFTKKEIADTATGKNLDMQNVYDALYPFAIKFGKDWSFGVKAMASLADRQEGLVVSFSFGKDFKLKTLDSLIADLNNLSNINNPTLVSHINHDISQIIFAEKPLEMQRYTMKEVHNPFSGKSETEIMILMASPYIPKRDKILYANYGNIFTKLELDYMVKGVDFYKLNRSKQRDAIYMEVDSIISSIDSDSPAPEINLQ